MKEALYISNSKASARKSKGTARKITHQKAEDGNTYGSFRDDRQKYCDNTEKKETEAKPPKKSPVLSTAKEGLGIQGLYNEWMVLCAGLCLCFLVLLTSGDKIKKISQSDGVAFISQYLMDSIDSGGDIAVFFGFENEQEDVAAEEKTEQYHDIPVFVYGEGLDDPEYIDKYNGINYTLSGQVPVFGVVSSEYAFRKNPFYNAYNGEDEYEFHSGVDIAAAEGTPILCYLDGTVEQTKLSASYGYYVCIDHGGGLKTLYAHASKLLCEEGDEVKRGDVIALVGSTGRATGPHLHFEVISDGFTVNPKKYLGELYEE